MNFTHWSNTNKKKYLRKRIHRYKCKNGEQLPIQQDSRKGSGILEGHSTIVRFNNVPQLHIGKPKPAVMIHGKHLACKVLPLAAHCCAANMSFLKADWREYCGEQQNLKTPGMRLSWIYLSQTCSWEQASPGKQAGHSMKEASFFLYTAGKIQSLVFLRLTLWC